MQNLHQNIVHSLDYLRDVIDKRLQIHFNNNNDSFSFPALKIEPDDAPLNHFLLQYKLNIEEYVILLLALAPHIQPNFIDGIVQKFIPQGGEFPEIGGVKLNNHRGMLPTGETVQFIIAGSNLTERLRLTSYFSSEHFFQKQNILYLEAVKDGEPRMSGRIILSQEYIEWLTIGKIYSPAFSPDFPAKRIETSMEWEDLVLRPATQVYIEDIKIWMQHHEALAQDAVISRKLKRGYRVLFYGPPGTGKTLAASLLGQQFSRDVYRIDLSQVVSKYIGETEKNLEKVFTKAENKNWILFFDESDALFGKRSSISSAHDKYANQEVSYLLTRIENYPGLIVLASNFKNNIDQAFIRRFNAVIHFPMPDAAERLAIWNKNIPASIAVQHEVNLKTFADKYELSGSAITNIMQYASLYAISRQNGGINNNDIVNGIKRELMKEDKIQ